MRWDRRNPAALPLLLLLIALTTAFLCGGERGQFYRMGHHNFLSGQHLALAANLSPAHNFLLFVRQYPGRGDSLAYMPYSRFPVGSYGLVKLALLPFPDNFPAQIYAARLLMLAFFSAAAALAFLSLYRLLAHRWNALAATALAFASYYGLYYNDMVSSYGAGLFGVMLTFHGIVLWEQEGRFRQLLVKGGIGLLLGWQGMALLLVFILLGLARAGYRSYRASVARGPGFTAGRLGTAVWAMLSSRYTTLGIIALLGCGLVLGFNIAGEYFALNGARGLTELPSVASMLNRLRADAEVYAAQSQLLAWPPFLMGQLSRIGVLSVPFQLVQWLEWDYAAALRYPYALGFVLGGGAVFGGSLLLLALAREKILTAALPLSGWAWVLPVRGSAGIHDFESLFQIGIPLVFFGLALQGLSRLGRSRYLAALPAMIALAALAIFGLSAYEMGKVGDESERAQRQREIAADLTVIRAATAGGDSIFIPESRVESPSNIFAKSFHMADFYLSGRVLDYKRGNQHPDFAPDYTVSSLRVAGPSLLTPENRWVFLYRGSDYPALGRAVQEQGELIIPSDYAVYRLGNRLVYIQEPCNMAETQHKVFLHIVPFEQTNLPESRREFGTDNRDFQFRDYGWIREGLCVALRDLPEYTLAGIRTGQSAAGQGRIWEGEAIFDLTPAIEELLPAAELVANAEWDLYRNGNRLLYVKEGCTAGDTTARFMLHIFPVRTQDLPEGRRQHGMDNRDFAFAWRGARSGDRCLAMAELPEYPILSFNTGQFNADGTLWLAEDIVDLSHVAANLLPGAELVIRAQWEVYRNANWLLYVKESCAEGDTKGRFFLHIFPERTADLSTARQQYGMDNLDFDFAEQGDRVGEHCLAVVELPDYGIAGLATGQFTPEGNLWTGRFPER